MGIEVKRTNLPPCKMVKDLALYEGVEDANELRIHLGDGGVLSISKSTGKCWTGTKAHFDDTRRLALLPPGTQIIITLE